MTKYFINEQYDVQDADASKGFGKGEKREDYADAWKDTGNIILIGLGGSGKKALANLLGGRTGLVVVAPKGVTEAVQVLGAGPRIIVLEDGLVEAAEVQALIHGSGKVFYIMVDSKILSERVADREGVGDTEALWREISARLAVMEPVFYSVLHFIMQGAQSPDELVDDAMEKIGY
ncbi:hypothetical protein SYK_34620 [Pseudodesulfovibrio nedwellii]|uniref:Uncharacterized protein n=1 Tax=Pseudodesulfovibrio nedwellii TaxID=2973072 RepID=A0ABN6S7E0_9BACT|nr:hypothetical protein [Pseudodesulfovibrio nedwellii]BDQ39102.1 hypothetical protein SYK_34620 [Pseudodesulfovibrio nedwellii]